MFKTLIIGAGKIGAFFDEPNSKNIFSHAHAVSKHNSFKLVGFVDNNIEQAQKASNIWGGYFFKNIKDAFNKTKFEVAVVCVPDKFHHNILVELSKLPIKAVFAEKPLALNLENAKNILNIYEKKEIPLLINYTRRFVPEFIELKNRIEKKEFGDFLFGNSFYSKGILHSATHHFDLLNFFLGKFSLKTIFNKRNDYYEKDPSIAGIYDFKGKNFILNFIGEDYYTFFEMNLFFEKKRIRISELGFLIEEFDAKISPYFANYTNLIKTKEYKVDLNNALFFAYNNLENIILKKTDPICSAKDALFALKIGLETLNRTL